MLLLRFPEVWRKKLEVSFFLTLYGLIKRTFQTGRELCGESSLHFAAAKGSANNPAEAPRIFPFIRSVARRVCTGRTDTKLLGVFPSGFSTAVHVLPAVLFFFVHGRYPHVVSAASSSSELQDRGLPECAQAETTRSANAPGLFIEVRERSVRYDRKRRDQR